MAIRQEDRARGQRVREIREARDEDQQTFAARVLKALPGRVKYDAAVISKTETGLRRLTFEEAQAALHEKERLHTKSATCT
jgi:hypothetical protein